MHCMLNVLFLKFVRTHIPVAPMFNEAVLKYLITDFWDPRVLEMFILSIMCMLTFWAS